MPDAVAPPSPPRPKRIPFRVRVPQPALEYRSVVGRWLSRGEAVDEQAGHEVSTHAWWRVIWLTGVDYFSTLGYQPGIAFLAAGALSPLATLVLVLVTLLVAVPVYLQVAARSPNGQGSIVMLEALLPRWRGKAFVLVLLGFAITDFVITITLSAADATDHVIHNPFVPGWATHSLSVALALVAVLGAVFLRGFREAIGLAVGIVAVYLSLNTLVLAVCLREWWRAAASAHGSPWLAIGFAFLLFPKLALGLSGFETGVAVMPLVRGDADDSAARPAGRIRNTRRLLVTAALVMSVLLIGSSLVTTLLIDPAEFLPGGRANGRALAHLAHTRLGEGFGTLYDLSTIAILWFAGASAMAGLLNLVPRYLPPYGMAPEWARATRPLTLVFTGIAVAVTVAFDADVDAQGGAYATGVLFLMTSAAFAVALGQRASRAAPLYWAMTALFVYTTVANVIERPEGVRIAAFFIGAIVASSLVSRVFRSTELRIGAIHLDETATRFVDEDAAVGVRLIAHRPDKRSVAEYERKEQQARQDHSLDEEPLVFLEVDQGDASVFGATLEVQGRRVGRHRVMRCESPAIPNAIAALLLHIRDRTGRMPDAYFGWTEGNPITYLLRYLALGEGDTAPMTREVLRRAIDDPHQRPRVHVG
jgi:hypothetical protein